MTLNLTDSIVATLAYFDIFDYPLTAMELQTYLWQNTNVDRFFEDSDRLLKNATIETAHGFYFLPGRGAIVAIRQGSVRHIAHKLDRAKKAGKLILWIPFVRAMFVCNTVAAGSADECSDIDVLVIVKAGRLWLTRLLVTGLLSVFRLRRTKTRIANQICLSFYLTDSALDLKSIALPNPDIYLCYWIRQLLPIYDPDNLWQKIQQANQWVNEFVQPAALPYTLIERYRTDDSRLSRGIKNLLEKFWAGRYGDLIESQAKGFEQTHMKMQNTPNPSQHRSVIVNDSMMKFHENDRREYFREEWRKQCEKFLTSNS